MPESISGRQLAHTLIIEKPDLKVIFTSGYSADLLGEDFEQSNDCGFLAKPYLPDRLASTIATCLQREPAMTS
jgi:two-component system cell cycle sensor histidine kinase/response regulator CckA